MPRDIIFHNGELELSLGASRNVVLEHKYVCAKESE
jgi:hypothetical protein